MDKGCARKSQVDQARPEKVERHLIGHSRRLRRNRAQQSDVVCPGLNKEPGVVRGSAGAMPFCSALVPKIQFSTGGNLGMTGDDLFDESSAGSWHPDDKDG